MILDTRERSGYTGLKIAVEGFDDMGNPGINLDREVLAVTSDMRPIFHTWLETSH